MQEEKDEERIEAKSRPTASAKNLITSSDPGKLTHSCRETGKQDEKKFEA